MKTITIRIKEEPQGIAMQCESQREDCTEMEGAAMEKLMPYLRDWMANVSSSGITRFFGTKVEMEKYLNNQWQ